MIAVRITTQGFQEKLDRTLRAARNPRAVMAAVGREGANQLKNHFRQKDRTDVNKLGGPREHFWNKVAQSVQSPVLNAAGNVVSININDPRFAQKVFGGVIRAKRVKNLAIPQTAEAYGRAPSTFEAETGFDLFFVSTRGAGVLARRVGEAGLQVEYILKPSVKQDPDPTALPDQQKFEQALADRADKVLQRQLSSGSGAPPIGGTTA